MKEKIKNKKILIIFHSGAGGTRTISEVLKVKLSNFNINTIIMEVKLKNFDYKIIENYDFLIFGTPTYSCKPSLSMKEFIEKMPIYKNLKPAFCFTTYGAYTGNILRILIKDLYKKNILTLHYSAYRSPGSDGVLLFKSYEFMFRYEKNIKEKLKKDIEKIIELLKISNPEKYKLRIPLYKWYAPLTDLLLYFGEKKENEFKKNMHILKERCIKCKQCIKECIREAWKENINTGEIELNYELCEFCLKCVHHCPTKAIFFSPIMKDKPRLNKKFYEKLKEDILK